MKISRSAYDGPKELDSPSIFQIPLSASEWRSGILLRSPNWLGDAVMSLPAISQIRKLLPDSCGIFVVCPPRLHDFFGAVKIIDRVIPVDSGKYGIGVKSLGNLKKLDAGIGLIFTNSFRDTLLFRLAKIPKVFGPQARFNSIFLTKYFIFDKKTVMHQASRYLTMARALGAPVWEGDFPEIVSDMDNDKMKKSLTNIASKKSPLLGIAPGAAFGKAKKWPERYFSEISARWVEKGGSVVILGTSKEEDCGKNIRGAPGCASLIDLCGQTDLRELAYVISNCDACVCNDSGIMHLAAALGRPGIAIFGSTSPDATKPLSREWTVLQSEEQCSPCFKRNCPDGTYRCMTELVPENVTVELEKIWRNICMISTTDSKK